MAVLVDYRHQALAEIERRRREQSQEQVNVGKEYTFYGGPLFLQTCLDPEIVISGPADTGKTLAGMYLLNQLAWQFPGLQGAIVRKTYKSMAGSVLQTLEQKILGKNSPVRCLGGSKQERYIYPNGSVLWIGGMDNPDKVLSSERDVIYVNQAEELSLPEWEILGSRATGRAGNMPDARIMGDCNPGPPTHWIRSRARSGTLTLIEATHRDNPEIYDPVTGEITEGGRKRLSRLSSLTGSRRQRLFVGLWVAPEGAIYEVFVEERHKVAAFPIPEVWPRLVGIDPYGSVIAAVWLAFDPANEILNVYREYHEPFGVTTRQHAKNILDRSKGETIWAWAGGGPSERHAQLDWPEYGIPLQQPDITDVWAGIDRVSSLLAEFRLVIHDSCPQLLSEIGDYRRQLKDGVPTETIENKESYHLLDALRYAVTWVAVPSDDEAEVHYSPVKITLPF